jgi:hypothetical protein
MATIKEVCVGAVAGRPEGKRFRLGVHELEGGKVHYVGRFYSSSDDDDAIMREIIREYNVAVSTDPECTMVMSKFDCDSGVHSGRPYGD